MKYIITGKSGQLARAFIERFTEAAVDFVAPEENELDITDPDKINRICSEFRPDVIINCAAYNHVDMAETQPDSAISANAAGPQLLARTAREHKARLVHFGSDYVFDGLKQNGLYTEDDDTSPLNKYGVSKLRGEELVALETDDYLILRLSWVFGDGTQNFIHKLLDWASQKDYLKIVCDEFSVPTYTHTVVDVTLRAIEKELPSGLYHLTNSGYCSRYEWARLVLRLSGISRFIRPALMADFELPARRPGFSAMTSKRISSELDIDIPQWEDAVRSFLERRQDA